MILELVKFDGGKAHTIRVEIDAEGNIKAQVKGLQGQEIVEVAKVLDPLGEVQAEEHGPEFHQHVMDTEFQHVGGW
jgi:hypothetical protein